MKTKIIFVVLIFTFIIFGGYFYFNTLWQRHAKMVGGSFTVTLSKGQKLLNAEFKGNDSVYTLTRDMRSDEFPESYKLHEHTVYGVLGQTIKIEERR